MGWRLMLASACALVFNVPSVVATLRGGGAAAALLEQRRRSFGRAGELEQKPTGRGAATTFMDAPLGPCTSPSLCSMYADAPCNDMSGSSMSRLERISGKGWAFGGARGCSIVSSTTSEQLLLEEGDGTAASSNGIQAAQDVEGNGTSRTEFADDSS